MELLSSAQNPKIKRLQLLQQKSSERRKSGSFVVEGQRELQHCLDAGFDIVTVFTCPEIMDSSAQLGNTEWAKEMVENHDDAESILARKCPKAKVFGVTPAIYDKIAYRGGTEGVIAEIKARHLSLKDIPQKDSAPLYVILESVEKPGNLGAILRSADAAGATAVIVCDPLTDLFNPNLIRSSIGAIFSVPCVACSSEECITWLKEHGVTILTAQLQDSKLYYDTDMQRPTAIVMGTEATGLTNIWREAADAHIRIPMLGQLDSLNVSVSAAILLFEAVRQRGVKR